MNPAAISKTIKKVKRQKRTIRLEDFSRSRISDAPIVVEPEKSVAPVKEEVKKVE